MINHRLLRQRHALLLALALAGVAPAASAEPPSGAAPSRAAGGATKSAQASTLSRAAAPDQGAAAADGPDARATRSAELKRKGNDAWDAGAYGEAIAYYEEWARVSQDPKAFYNLASACQKVGRNAEALTWLQRFQEKASPDERAQAPNVPRRIATLRNKVALLKVNVNVAGARVLVRNSVVGTKPPEGPLEVPVNAGHAVIEINAEGYKPYRDELELPSGSPAVVTVHLTQQGDLKPSTGGFIFRDRLVDKKPFWSQWWFWAGASVLVAGGAATIYALSTEKGHTEGGPLIPTSTALPSRIGLSF
ncbi:MAG TPA: tetratricopeptide repeat protein [Polyangiaceae bacterium]|nr:tetratricopeptide repeat protein [Polyangiaceae bacterium]